jgi:hypothetical protein
MTLSKKSPADRRRDRRALSEWHAGQFIISSKYQMYAYHKQLLVFSAIGCAARLTVE